MFALRHIRKCLNRKYMKNCLLREVIIHYTQCFVHGMWTIFPTFSIRITGSTTCLLHVGSRFGNLVWNDNRYKVWNGISHPFSNCNDEVVGVWQWISNFNTHFIMDVITYPRWDFSLSMAHTTALRSTFPFRHRLFFHITQSKIKWEK